MKFHQSKICCGQSNKVLPVLLLIILCAFKVQALEDSVENTVGGGEYKVRSGECLTEESRAEIKIKLQESINRLRAEGKLDQSFSFMAPIFIFPIVKNPAVTNDYGVHGISNFVDHNTAFPNQLRDFNCGTRTYDTNAGYNHKGVDMFTFPFGINKMDNNEAMAVAAAPGQIILKSNGNFDRNCAFNNNNWNAVYVRHADGTVSWYGHLKNNSLTSKAVGEQVLQGEYLGIIGSSGNSTGPHLHFEIYDSAGRLQDPYQGSCNLMNTATYWQNQPEYNDSKINKVMTHSAPPSFQACPNPDIINEKNVFSPGGRVIVAAYYHDQLINQPSQYSLIRPDGTTFQTWSHSSPNSYLASYWYWTPTLPANAPTGTWKFRVVFQSQTYEHSFQVRAGNNMFDFDGDGRSDVSVFRPENGSWYIQQSTAGFTGLAFGISTDKLAPADYDGDGKTDVAVVRNGIWYLQRSTAGFTGIQFGDGNDVPVPADYDGDGKADVAVFRPSNGYWYILNSSNNQLTATLFGISTDKPVPADYDGDGKADVAVNRAGNWYINRSQLGFTGIAFGDSNDKLVPADYDGDGKADVAVFRPSNGSWYLLQSQAGFTGIGFGLGTDIPAATDYDGDGKADIAVVRNGNWYLQRSLQGFTGIQFGTSTDKPIPNAFVK